MQMNNKTAIVDVTFPFPIETELFVKVQPYVVLPLWKRIYYTICGKKNNQEERDNWLYELINIDNIILFDKHVNYYSIAKKIEDKYPEKKLIFYAWNPLGFSDDWKLLSKKWKKLTFSKADGEINGFNYVGTFYNFSGTNINTQRIKWDGLFIGLDKGRLNLINAIRDTFIKSGLSPKIIVVDNRKALYNSNYSRYLDYSKVCEYIEESRTIIDIVQGGQEGLTMRVMESLFYKKKLITNNKNIVNYEFYNPKNIFIWGNDDQTNLYDFVNSEYQQIDENIIKYFSFNNWINKIITQ